MIAFPIVLTVLLVLGVVVALALRNWFVRRPARRR